MRITRQRPRDRFPKIVLNPSQNAPTAPATIAPITAKIRLCRVCLTSLRGSAATDSPQAPKSFCDIILKTAKALDIKVSPTLLARANAVIE
jgi:hypothetical protein